MTIEKITDKITLVHGDCLEYMRGLSDNAFELAVVDGPYGIGADKHLYRRTLTKNGNAKAKNSLYHFSDWDKSAPTSGYFNDLWRISRNQIVWGANHFIECMPRNSPCWIVWDKDNGSNDYADCELAWTSFKGAVRKFKWRWHGMLQEDMGHKELRIHPTQKPVALYKWLYERWAIMGDRILDTHLGSGSSAIAAYDLGFEFVGIEIDKEYYEAAKNRLLKHIKQQEMQPRLNLEF